MIKVDDDPAAHQTSEESFPVPHVSLFQLAGFVGRMQDGTLI
jgi:hypothetical protein